MLLSLSLRGVVGGAAAARAAQEVARVAARKLLLPLLDHAIARLAAVLRRTWHIVVEHAMSEGARMSHRPPAAPARMLPLTAAFRLPACLQYIYAHLQGRHLFILHAITKPRPSSSPG